MKGNLPDYSYEVWSLIEIMLIKKLCDIFFTNRNLYSISFCIYIVVIVASIYIALL